MRRILLLVVALTGLVTTLQAQSWHSEFGFQMGYTRVKPAGTGASDHIDVFSLPAFNLPGIVPAGASLFAIIPWKNKVAIETSAGLAQGDAFFLIGEGTFFDLGLRANYAITPKLYAAAGGRLNWIESGGLSETQLGVQTAVGYRFGFIAGLRGRIEANASFLGKSEFLAPANTYGLEFGVSKQLGGRARTAAPARNARAWQPALGLQGGYARAHAVGGGGDATVLSFPGLGGGATVLGSPAGPPVLFAILPVGKKIAIEPGFDFNRLQGQGQTLFGANVSARLNYAVSGGWYAAAGGNLNYIKVTGGDAETITGGNVAWGYRFPLVAGLGGRVEIDYTMMAKNDGAGFPAINTFGLQFAATLPLK
ncbi:MAG TPA: hypothetical protein VFO67_10945 [Gemmatimonadales bacterium]|nr:hypothetical protein [Gemmatimonadales bacterium]